jgi:hypothetical protein
VFLAGLNIDIVIVFIGSTQNEPLTKLANFWFFATLCQLGF